MSRTAGGYAGRMRPGAEPTPCVGGPFAGLTQRREIDFCLVQSTGCPCR